MTSLALTLGDTHRHSVESPGHCASTLCTVQTDASFSNALSYACGVLNALNRPVAHSLAELGDIDLPDAAPTEHELSELHIVAPLYLAFEMEQIGLLRTADRVAALFASGAITQPLGKVAEHLNRFWRNRRERLSEQERMHLLEQLFSPSLFYPQFQPFCQAIIAMADNQNRRVIFEEVALQVSTRQLRETIFPHIQGMMRFAAVDLVQNVQDALSFLRERTLLIAFNARSLWGLLALEGRYSESQIRQHVEMANAGQLLLSWLAQGHSGSAAMPPDLDAAVFGAAQRWLMAYQATQPSTYSPYGVGAPTPSTNFPAYG